MPDDTSTPTQHLTSGESQVIEAFAQKYGEGHVLLACHVAFPMVLTADLVYKIWQNFRNYTNENGKLLEIPYIAVSDFLLSPLCQPSGYQRFEMPANFRQTLLEALQNDPDFGKPRLQELAAFLKHYIESTYRDADAIGQAIRNAQQLMVDAWLEPEKALQTLTQAFLESENAPAEQVRLSNLMQGFSIQWSSGLMAEGLEMPKQAQTVLRYSQGLSAFHKTGNAGHAADILKGIIQKGDSGLVLPLPGEVKTTMSRRLSQPQKGKLFALLIALDECHPSTNVPPLRGCKNDARELANWVEAAHKAENSPWSEIRVEMLFDEQATFSILEKRAELLQEIGPEDQVLIFFAGHARAEKPEDETDLICYDSLLPNGQKLTVSRFRNLVLSNARQQPYITVVLDAEFTGYPNWLDPTNPRHVVFANTGLRENGYELNNSGGFFTKYFIDALVQNGGQVGNAALFVDTISGMAQDELSEKQHPQFYAPPLGAERPFLQALDPTRALKRQLRLSGASLADLQKRFSLPEHASKQQWQSSLTTFLAEKEQTDAPLFLFVFSDADGDLPGVQQEMNQVKSLVEEQLQNTRIEAAILHNPDFQELQQYFTAPEYRNRLHWFHFSGLDKENTPIFQSSSKMAMKKARPIQQQSNIGSFSNIGDEPEGPAKSGFLLADGLLTFFEFAPWLVYQQNLRLAFINSCFSNHTAAWATQLGAWNAIGVEGEVSDSAATKFAVDFYSKWMVKGNALSAAFQEVLEASRNGAGPDAGSTAHRSARPPEEDSAPAAAVPFQLKTAAWLTTSWRGERFGDYNLIADSGLRALVFEYDTLDVSDKKERVSKKMQLAQKMGEVINSLVTDKGLLLGPRSSQGLLVGLVNAVRHRPAELDTPLLLKLAPMAEQLFAKYEWVEAADGLLKLEQLKSSHQVDLYTVLEQFDNDADEDLKRLIESVSGVEELEYADAYNDEGSAFHNDKHYGKAIFCYNRAMRLDPEYSDTYYNRGVLFDTIGREEEALSDYNKAIELNPDDADAFNNRGILFYNTAQIEKALADYNKAIGLNPDYADAFNNRGFLFNNLGRQEEALADYNKAIELNPNVADVFHNRGIFFENIGRKEEALADYNKAIELKSDDAEAFFNRGVLFATLERTTEALADYNKAIGLNPDYADALNNRGILLDNLGRKEEALADYTKAIELNPDDADAFFNRGVLLDNLNRKEEALADFNKAIELNSDDADNFHNRGILFATLERTTEALADYNKAIELKPDFAEAFNNRGILLDNLGRKEDALADYNKAIGLKSDFAEAFNNRGFLLNDFGRKEEAIADYTKAIELRPDFADAFNNRGDLYRNTDKYKEAIEDVSRAISIDPDFSYAHGTLAEIYAQLGEDEQFFTHLETALSKGYPLDQFIDDPAYNNYKDQPRFLALLGKTRLTPEMVFIKGGTFTMGWVEGRDGEGERYETPAHEVSVNDFYIGKYLVTQAQWQAIMGDNPSKFKDDNTNPVEFISWNDIQEFIRKLNAKTGKNYRLPSEAEWEYAARGGLQTEGFLFAGSNNVNEVAWYKTNSEGKTHPVCSLKSNELGLFDMSGNVWEWCNDWYSGYSSATVTNPKGPDKGEQRVFRGGSWDGKIGICRIFFRGRDVPERRGNSIGFRLAHDAENF